MNLRAWWNRFKAQHIVAMDPTVWTPELEAKLARDKQEETPKAADILPQHTVPARIVPTHVCRMKYGVRSTDRGWRVIAQNDAAIVELIWCAWNLSRVPYRKAR